MQVLGNLVSNAVEHTAQGEVSVVWSPVQASDMDMETFPEALVYKFEISDTGEGIPSAALDHIFRDFEEVASTFQSPTEQENVSHNTIGLGLAVVARIVNNMGGQLRAQSVISEGSTFSVVLPFAADRSHSPEGGQSRPNSMVGNSLRRTGSHDSGGSKKSQHSNNSIYSAGSQKSEIDSLVDAMSFSSDTQNPTGTRSVRPPPITRQASTARVPPANNRIIAERTNTQVSVSPKTSFSPPTSPSPSQSSLHGRRRSLAQSIGSIGSSDAKAFAENPLRILVVDDDKINRAIIGKKLEKGGHIAVMTVHGGEAVRCIEKDRGFDLILMDLQMPICDGKTATERIRKLEQETTFGLTPRIPIVAVSASLHEDHRHDIIKSGMDGWLLKPLTSDRLSAVLAGVKLSEYRRKELYRPGHFARGGWFAEHFPRPRPSSSSPSKQKSPSL